MESAARQKGRGQRVTFSASYARVYAATLAAIQELRFTVVGQNQREGYVWAQRRPEPLRSWELLVPTPRVLTRGLQQAATPGHNVAIYFYPVSEERVLVEIIDQRVSPLGIDRLLGEDIVEGIARRLAPTESAVLTE